jgi:hypothetical protein
MSYFLKHRSHSGANLVEYLVLTVLLLSALYLMKDTISRGIFSKYKAGGDSFAFGRQYDARRTTVCKTDNLYDNKGVLIGSVTYDEDCYQSRVRRDPSQGGCFQCGPGAANYCYACEDNIKSSCQKAYCNQ